MIGSRDLADLLRERLLEQDLENESDALSAEPFHDVVVDSRRVEPGDLFVALPGQQTDGHLFIDDAIQRGARGLLCRTVPDTIPDEVSAFVVDDPLESLQAAAACWRSRQGARVVGITGSVGKTTTREAITQVLRRRFATLESPRNFNGDIGLPIALLGLAPEHEWGVMEMGPYDRAEMELLTRIGRPDVGVVTNVGPTHLERFGSIEATEEIKGLLPACLPDDGLAVLNADDERVARMTDRTSARVVTFGLGESANIRATAIASRGLDGITFTLHAEGETTAVQTPAVGAHQAMTALAATAVGLFAGVPLVEIVAALGELESGSRLRPRRSTSGALILDDAYNAAPLSVKAALDVLSELPGNKIAVLGDMLELGDEEEAGHREVGAYCMGRCDRLIAIGERARGIADGAWDAGHQQIQWFGRRDDASRALRREIGADDVVLVKASYAMHLEEMVEALVSGEERSR